MHRAEAFIYDWARTPRGRGKRSGALHRVKPIQLLQTLFTELKKRNDITRTAIIDDVIIGCVTAVADQGANIARAALLFAGWDQETAGFTLNRFCASGLEVCNIAAAKIAAGFEEAIVAGGVESMSRIPIAADGGAWYIDPEVNHRLRFVPQGVSADIIATCEGFTRKQLDEFAVSSHKKAHLATVENLFQKSMCPVHDRAGELLLASDEMIRADCSLTEMGKLKPSFTGIGDLGFDAFALDKYPQLEKISHLHHPGNSSAIVDGAALMLIGSARIGQELNLKPRAKFISVASVGSEPTIMLTGTKAATLKALAKASLQLEDIDLFEVNEAFAAVVLKYLRDLAIDPDKVNVNGGAIAMGHPLGATGTMVLGALLDELERRDLRTGLATFCAGTGMATATIIERV